MRGLSGPRAAAEVRTLAEFYNVHKARIYEVARAVRPERKKRSDAGRRKYDMMANPALRFAAELVVNQKLSPELALYDMVEANADLVGKVPDIRLGTFRRYLREHGVSRTQAKKNRMTYRSFQADFPGQIFQFDISGVKERWVDVKTRAVHKVSVLEVSGNHSNRRQDRVPLWKMVIVDDFSRKKLVRFVACQKPNTVHVVDFLKFAFSRMGLSYKLYTDKDAIIHNKRMKRGARFLDEAFKESGGFELFHHTPGNPQATGKVERGHQIVEEYEKLIGVKAEFGNQPTVEALNRFADWMCDRYNNRICRATGTTPNNAFRATTNPLRMIEPAAFDAAFKARDLHLKVHADVTISVDGVKYQLSRRDADPFNLLAETGQKIEVYWLDDDDFFACVTPAGDEYIVQKIAATPDAHGENKKLPESRSEKTRKALKESQAARSKEIRDLQKEIETPIIIVPGIDTEKRVQTNEKILTFPQRVETGDVDRLHELTHHIANDAPEYSRALDLFDALELMQAEGLAPSEPGTELTEMKVWLRAAFAGREVITEAELTSVFANSEFGKSDHRIAMSR